MFEALREGTPNRKQIALTIIKDGLDESSFEAAPVGATRFIPGPLSKAAAGVVDKLHGSHGSGSPKGDGKGS